MDDPNELARDMITGTISDIAAKVLETKPALNLLGPVTAEVGNLMGQIASVARFYATDNMARIFTRWAENRKGELVTENEFRRVLPLFPTASLVSDETLQERWARLLESFSKWHENVLPSFGHTLGQLTAEEARYLEHLWRHPQGSSDRMSLLYLYTELLNEGEPKHDAHDKVQTPQRVHDQFHLIFSDITRLGLLEIDIERRRDTINLNLDNPQAFMHGLYTQMTDEKFCFSGYGIRFMEAISERISD